MVTKIVKITKTLNCNERVEDVGDESSVRGAAQDAGNEQSGGNAAAVRPAREEEEEHEERAQRDQRELLCWFVTLLTYSIFS